MHRSLISNQPLGSKVSLPTVLNCTVRRHEHYPILPWVSSSCDRTCTYTGWLLEPLPLLVGLHSQIGRGNLYEMNNPYRLPKYFTKETLTSAVAASTSMIQTISKLYPRYSAGIIPTVKKYIKLWSLDTSHWRQQGWSKGLKRPELCADPAVTLQNASGASRQAVRRAFLRLVSYECSRCKISTWLNEPAPLQVDHINGNNSDHRIENLRLLCANCHALTPTFSGRNKKNGSP